jgi:SNF2 family DNA or RNA helicase
MQLRKICNHPFVFRPVEEGMVNHLRKRGEQVTDLAHNVDYWRCCGKFELLDRVLPKFKKVCDDIVLTCSRSRTMFWGLVCFFALEHWHR